MFSCWDKDPESRPTFNELENSISNCIEASIIQRFIDLNEPFLEENSSHFQSGQIDYMGMMRNYEY